MNETPFTINQRVRGIEDSSPKTYRALEGVITELYADKGIALLTVDTSIFVVIEKPIIKGPETHIFQVRKIEEPYKKCFFTEDLVSLEEIDEFVAAHNLKNPIVPRLRPCRRIIHPVIPSVDRKFSLYEKYEK